MMNIKSKNEEFTLFNQLSDEWWNENGKFKILHQIKSHRMSYILDQVNNRNIRNLKILDVGCGGGIICEPLARLGAKVTGIDFAPNNIIAAKIHSKKNKLKINYINKDIEKSKLDEKFDIILMFEVLEHLDNFIGAMEEIHRISLPGCLVKISVPYWNSSFAYIDPTHKRGFHELTFSFFDPDSEYCKERPYYTKARFKIKSFAYVIAPFSPYISIPFIKEIEIRNKILKKIVGLLGNIFSNIILDLRLELERV